MDPCRPFEDASKEKNLNLRDRRGESCVRFISKTAHAVSPLSSGNFWPQSISLAQEEAELDHDIYDYEKIRLKSLMLRQRTIQLVQRIDDAQALWGCSQAHPPCEPPRAVRVPLWGAIDVRKASCRS